jgi:hypothetical protein
LLDHKRIDPSKIMSHLKTVAKWGVASVAVLAVSLALSTNSNDMLALLEVGGKIALLIAAIYGTLKARRERLNSGLSKDAFEIAKAGGPQKLLEQSKQVRLIFYLLCALPFVSFIYSASNGSLTVALQMLLIVTLIVMPFAGLIYWNQNRMKAIANKELGRQQGNRHSVDPYR